MNDIIPNGVWPTMVTPFTESNAIDYKALAELIEWYLRHKVDGLFAVCQSSEMFYLSLQERVELAKFIKEKAGKVPVIASGHISNSTNEQIKELKALADTKIDALVLVTNRFAEKDEGDMIWKKNFERIINELENVPLGFYECPYPYKRLFTPELLKFCTSTNKIYFLKDTSCNLNEMKAKIDAVNNTKLKIFNANAATFYESLKIGISGYSGVMGNFHPQLYKWLFNNWTNQPQSAEKLQNFLGLASLIERQCYPVNAKYYLQLEGLNITLNSRSRDKKSFSMSNKIEVKQLHDLTVKITRNYNFN